MVEARARSRAVSGLISRFIYTTQIPGDYIELATPVPIPNTVVKPSTADGTAGATPWESRSLPGLLVRPNVNYSRSAFFL